ncbi:MULTISPECIES: phage tail tape measure protein [unclassified Pseudoalteromonas]|uniref:phage tail tape measure protein n=1 Tax=unclassified Pseudoalteromonas TaxID=194690 RepID=UPI001108301E|nr:MULTISPECIES: phage tail tape measure protein [unclassified Pseudoalteromonas]MCO7251375.1 phage tail tape measure protein [Pseudoalteromonas sp. Ps84H-4]TMO43155.1 phage tail tape measure protein [Pseudoalteromonas sp. S4389]
MATLSKLDKLTYSIGIIDKVTGPVNKVMAKINQLSQQAAAAQDQMMRGAATAVAGGFALARSLTPAIDHVAAIGEVQSLGVADEALQKLTKTSYEFGFQFGGNSAEFVRSAYDIQSAIAGLSGDELSEFTKTSNILAVATKADAATITSYMGTMYGIFEKTANKMGKADWVNQIAGQTATAVQLYKTTGAEMQAAFSNLGATATNIGLSSAQQFALVGELQLVAKSGSVAGTQAASLLQGIGKAEQALGIQLTADNGDMLAIDVVLGRINERLSSLGSVARGDVLTQIFGKQGAKAVDVLSTKVDKLKEGINVFENVQDSSKAQEMANIIASPWDRLGGSFNAAATAMGNRLLPVVEPFVEMLAAGFAGIVALTEQFPVLSSALATAVVVVVGLVTAFGLANFAMGLFKYSGLTLTPIISGLKYATGLYSTANKALASSLALSTGATNKARTVSALTAAQTMAQTKATQTASIVTTLYAGATNKARIAYELFNNRLLMPSGLILSRIKALGFIGTMKAIPTVLAAGLASMGKFAMGLFNVTRIMGFLNAVMLANPIGVIIGLVALLAAIVYKYWQPIKAFMSGFWDGFVHSLAPVIDVFSGLGKALEPIISAIKSAFMWFASLFSPVDKSGKALEEITSTGQAFGLIFGAALDILLLPLKAVVWGITKVISAVTWLAESISNMWDAVKSPLGSFFDFITTVFSWSPMGLMMQGYGKAFDWLSEKVGGLKGVVDSIKDFFNFGDDETTVKATKVIENTQAPQPNNFVMQNADQAFSRDYGQTVISKAAMQPANSVITTNTLNSAVRNNVSNVATQAANSATSNTAVNSVIEKSVSNTATQVANSVTAKTAVNSAVENSASNVATQAVNSVSANTAVNSAIENSASNTAIQTANSVTANTAVNSVIENSVSNVATQAANSITAMSNYAAANDAINTPVSSTATNNYVGQSTQLTQLATQSALQSTVVNPTNNFTNAANSPVFDSSSVQLASLNQAQSTLQTLPTTKTDQVITNAVNTSAYKVDQLSNEQEQQSNSYKAKVQKSSFLQNLTRNTSYTDSRSDSDNRKSVHIDSLTIKSDDPAQSFEQLMELAG